jgi:putative transposase
MPGSAARILITERQRNVLQEIAHSRTAPLHLTQRAPIILRAFERTDNQDIAAEIDLNQKRIHRLWR